MLCQDEANVTDIATSSSYYGDPSIRPPRQVGPGYGSPPPVPVPDQNCYVETPCTRYRFIDSRKCNLQYNVDACTQELR